MDNAAKNQLEIVNQLIKELVGIYRGAVSSSGISENEFWIWYALVVMDGKFTQQDICEMWSLSKQTVNTIITAMCRKGYTELELIQGTRNKKLIRLTDEGRKYGESIVNSISDAENRALKKMSAEDFTSCIEIMGKFNRILREEIRETRLRKE